VLGGGAWAATKLQKNSVGSKQIKDGAVALKDISKDARAALAGQNGAPGAPGAPGANGTSIVARPVSSGVVTTPDSGAVTVPLSANSWTASAGEVDQLPVAGRLTVTPPNIQAGCEGNGPTATLFVEVDVNGQSVATGLPGEVTNGVQHTGGLAAAVNMPEPGIATPRTVTVKISDDCPSPGDNFQIDALNFDVVAAR
jgi:hypothetical protein